MSRRIGRAKASSPPRPKAPATRTCVGCRKRFEQQHLLRVVLEPAGETLYVDYLSKLPGRGAYICAAPACLRQAVERGGLKRAFRQNVSTTLEALVEQTLDASHRQLRSLLSLAQRAGQIATGTSRVEQQLRQFQGECLLLAQDASPGVQRKFRLWAERNGMAVYPILSKADMGAATGYPELSLAVVLEPGFAKKIEMEIERTAQLVPLGTGGVEPGES